MSHAISRMYGSKENADNAVAELEEDGFGDIYVVSPPASADASIEQIALQIGKCLIPMSDARIYAPGVANGGTLVTVHAPFGSGRHATNIMDSHGPIASGMPEPAPEVVWDEATPVSCALHMPVLLDDAAPVSNVMGFSPLTSPHFSLSGLIGMPLVTEGPEKQEGRWGMPFLSNNPTPLSSLIGMPVLKKDNHASY